MLSPSQDFQINSYLELIKAKKKKKIKFKTITKPLPSDESLIMILLQANILNLMKYSLL